VVVAGKGLYIFGGRFGGRMECCHGDSFCWRRGETPRSAQKGSALPANHPNEGGLPKSR
jgi:hypothetical protein